MSRKKIKCASKQSYDGYLNHVVSISIPIPNLFLILQAWHGLGIRTWTVSRCMPSSKWKGSVYLVFGHWNLVSKISVTSFARFY